MVCWCLVLIIFHLVTLSLIMRQSSEITLFLHRDSLHALTSTWSNELLFACYGISWWVHQLFGHLNHHFWLGRNMDLPDIFDFRRAERMFIDGVNLIYGIYDFTTRLFLLRGDTILLLQHILFYNIQDLIWLLYFHFYRTSWAVMSLYASSLSEIHF